MSTSTPKRPKRDKPPIKRRVGDKTFQDNSGPQSIEKRSFDYATERPQTSGSAFVHRKHVPISRAQHNASLEVLSQVDEIADLPPDVSDHVPMDTHSSDYLQNQSCAVETDAEPHRFEWLIEALEQSERTREDERNRHECREKMLMETVQAMGEIVDGYEREILRQKNVEQDLMKNLASILDELEVLRTEKQIHEDETKKLRARFARAREHQMALDEELNSERQQKEQLFIEIERETYRRIISETRSQELEKKMKEQQNESVLQKKKQEIEKNVGVPVHVRRIDRLGAIKDEDLDKLTPAMVTQMKNVMEQFVKLHPVQKIEYIFNDYLYKQFDETRAKFRKMGRGTNELLVFHGTDRKNINSYASIRPISLRILSSGFAIGGVDAHPVAHGSSMV